jgi:hypothetical protein
VTGIGPVTPALSQQAAVITLPARNCCTPPTATGVSTTTTGSIDDPGVLHSYQQAIRG